MKKQIFIVALLTIFGSVAMFLPRQVAATGGFNCQSVTMPVALAPLLPATQTVAGELCLPQAGAQQVDVLVAGATYNRAYWDWPQNPALYSYKTKTLNAGRATFVYDRLGTGASSRPLSTSLNLSSDAYVLHQIVGWLRNPVLNFDQVTTIGHSLGSGIVITEAAQYGDVDRVVVTGFLHATGSGIAQAPTMFQPAAIDPQFIGKIFDPGYLTTIPGKRDIFYNTAFVDPAVIAYDEAHKDVVAATESADFLTLLLPPQINIARFITTDVLVVSGQQDALSCGGLQLDCTDQQAVQANEQQYFTAASSVTAQTVPNTGHNLTLHPSANASFDIVNDWIINH